MTSQPLTPKAQLDLTHSRTSVLVLYVHSQIQGLERLRKRQNLAKRRVYEFLGHLTDIKDQIRVYRSIPDCFETPDCGCSAERQDSLDRLAEELTALSNDIEEEIKILRNNQVKVRAQPTCPRKME